MSWRSAPFALATAACLVSSACATAPPRAGSAHSLAALVTDPAPWLHMEAESEQRPPLYLGATPRELALGLRPEDAHRVRLAASLRSTGEAQVAAVRSALARRGLVTAGERIELEAWPALNDQGQLTWVLARWRTGAARWAWLDAAMLDSVSLDPAPALPAALHPWEPDDFSLVFADFLALPGLYDKPSFGDCVWIRESDGSPIEAWLPTAQREAYGLEVRQELAADEPRRVCLDLPQPARLVGRPTTFSVTHNGRRVVWPREVEWEPEVARPAPSDSGPPRVASWPGDFAASFQTDDFLLSGAREAAFPASGRTERFQAKSSADEHNQLEALVDYLEERYARLGIETRRQRFLWRGISQSNLVAVIPGSAPAAANRPVVMADHIDTAFCEDLFAQTRERRSAPGADDNDSATAVLLRAAEILRDSRPRHDIWLLHLTGEEYPGDDLGVRHFLGQLLAERRDIGGVVLMDMIGYRDPGDRVFQISAGDSAASLRLAAVALAAAAREPELEPALRLAIDPESYLYNTDGLVISQLGYPVILLNEHLNRGHNLMRAGYHDSTDTVERMDWDYATAIGRVAIETVARLADAHP